MDVKLNSFQLNPLLCIWVIVRLAIIMMVVYFLSDDLAWLTTILAIHLMSTPFERIFFFLVLSTILGGSFILAQLLRLKWLQYLLPLLVALILFLILFHLLPGSNPIITAIFLTGTLALNTVSDRWFVDVLAKNIGHKIGNIIFIAVIGLSEFLLLKPFLWWLLAQWHGSTLEVTDSRYRWISWLPTTVLVPALAALLLNAYSLANLHRTLYPDPAVHKFAKGNFNWLALDQEQHILYATGHGTNYLQVYNIDQLENSPQMSRVETGYAEGFTYNPLLREIYIYNQLTYHLLILDTETLELKKSIPTPQISPGDAWMAWDRVSNNIVIASEADELEGSPTIVVNRATGDIVDTLDVDPGSLTLHPIKPWVYMSFFRRNSELLIYDAQLRKIVRRAPAQERLDRMVFTVDGNELELLIPSPVDSVVLRFNAETLERKGTIKTVFGARAIAVDPLRNLLLCGSLVTNMLEVIDLTTQQRLAEYYVGPWLRTINLDTEAGIAYVSSHEGLFAIQYTDQLKWD